MRAIGIRELRQHASRYLREVQQGETLEVTDRGQPVARLVPVPRDGGFEELAASGRLVVGHGDVLDLGPPLAPLTTTALPSETLTEIRSDER
jgi:prevent-host-death family protein